MVPYETLNEGYSLGVYPDSIGIPTIGIGHNLPAGGRAAIESLPGHPNYDDVLSGRTNLTPEQVSVLFNTDMSSAIDTARGAFHSFDTLPASVQIALADMAFNLGSRINQFVDLQNAVAQHDWEAAVHAMLDSAWADQVHSRADRDAFLIYMPQYIIDIQEAVKSIIEQAPPFEMLDAYDPNENLDEVPGDYPAPTSDGTAIAMTEAGPFSSDVTPADSNDPQGYQEGPGWDGGVVGDPTAAPGTAGDGYSGGGFGDPSPPMGDYSPPGEGVDYGQAGFGDGGYGTGASFGGGQGGDGEAGGQFGGGGGGYDGEGGYGGYGEGGDGNGGEDGGE